MRGLFFIRIITVCVTLGILSASLSGCGSGGEGEIAVVENFAIAYVKRPVPAREDNDRSDLRDAIAFRPGGDLYIRDLAAPGASEHNITGVYTGGMGDVKDLTVSYDGQRLLFAMRAPEIEGADPEDQPTWNLWEYELPTGNLRRVIATDNTAEAGQDIAPAYLPDGRIVFSSTRQRQSKAILLDEGKPQFDALEESLDQPAAVLHVMNADGSDIRQISFNQSHDLHPSVLSSGEIVFSRWNRMGGRNEVSLYKVRPDGTGLQPLYGGYSHATGTDGSTVQFTRSLQREDGRLVSLIRPFTTSGGAGDAVAIDIDNFIDNDRAVAAMQGLAGPGQTSLFTPPTRTDDEPSPGGRYIAVSPLWDGTQRVLASWSLCRLIDAGDVILPCTAERLADPTLDEAPPLYGVYVIDAGDGSRRPIVPPAEGVMITEVVAMQPRALPAVIPDGASGTALDPNLIEENAGALNIRSVYDIDGAFNARGSGRAGIAALADPAQTTADERPARFLRIAKAVSIPGDEVIDLPNTAFGAGLQQRMREIVGYAPIEPDGSVKIKVPADTALAVSVLDRNGRRLGGRHQFWLQVRPGETLQCNGCHNTANGGGHGHAQGPAAVHTGSQLTGEPYPNTLSAFFTDFGETMAETRTRIDPAAMTPSVDLVYEDVWTDEAAAGRAQDASFALRYADLATPAPVDADCQAAWHSLCRIVIHYERHIHPLWTRDRGDDTCTACHGTDDGMGALQVPAAQLDLGDGPSPDVAEHFKSYRELLFGDNEQEIIEGALQDRLVSQGFDDNGIEIFTAVPVQPAMSATGAAASNRFFSRFNAGGSHEGRLDPAELRLISEWLDIGAQYYNDPFAVPVQ